MQQLPPSEEVMRALQSAVLDRQTTYIKTAQGTACILPMEDYIRLSEMKATLIHVVTHIQQGDMMGVLQTVEVFSKWLLEGGGETYILEEGEDARTL